MAWTISEMDAFLTEVSPHLKPAVAGRDFIVVGYSLRDQQVRELVESSGGSIWFTHPKAVPDHLKDNKAIRAVVEPECAFETFFPALATALQVDVPKQLLDAVKLEPRSTETVASGAQTMDDLMSATLGIAGSDGIAVSTAFLLAEPRVIVCDRYAGKTFIHDGMIDVIASGDHRFRTKVIRSDDKHAFGPLILEAPEALQVPGLRLVADPLEAGSVVQILVAAGTKTGISTGTVTKSHLDPMSIEPIRGKVRNLAELECVVAPGSSGAPVVDDTMAVCGFIVAGSSDPNDPRSFAYPAKHWVPLLSGGKKSREIAR